MPYTQEEAQKLTFYTNFRDDLREEYLVKVKESSDLSTPFRDDNNVLLSYENIENNEGIETVTISDESIYKLYTTQENIEQSKTFSNRLQTQYDKTKLLNNIIERDITELSEDIIADGIRRERRIPVKLNVLSNYQDAQNELERNRPKTEKLKKKKKKKNTAKTVIKVSSKSTDSSSVCSTSLGKKTPNVSKVTPFIKKYVRL